MSSSPAIKQEPYSGVLASETKPNVSRKRSHGTTFGDDSFSASQERDIQEQLDVGLSRSETAQRPGPGGCRLTYIEGWKVIHDANRIFGFNGWSSNIVALDVRYVDERNGRFSACVGATIRITLRDGCYREDRGGGCADNMRSKGEAVMKAEKEAVTDGVKRALKNFGMRLGLSLYDRQYVREMNRPNTAKAPTTTTTTLTTPRPGSSGIQKNKTYEKGGINDAYRAQREEALQRKQRFLEAKAKDMQVKMQQQQQHQQQQNHESGRMGNGISMRNYNNRGVGGGINATKGNMTSPVTPKPHNVNGGHATNNGALEAERLAKRQREIDEMTRMAYDADF